MNVKKIHPVLLLTLSVIVFTISFIGAPYIFAQSAFDFSLLNGGNKSVVQGSSVSNTITTTSISGTPAPVSFSVSGLPPDSSASFSPSSCTPSSSGAKTCTPTPVINISTDTLTPAGVYTITVTGTSNAPTPPPSGIGFNFPSQNTTAFGYCNSVITTFYGVIKITNSSSNDVRFRRTSFTTPTPPAITGSSPSSFIVTAGSTLMKGGFGNVTYSDSGCLIEVPSNNVIDGSATYRVEKLDGTIVVPEVIYSWDYTH